MAKLILNDRTDAFLTVIKVSINGKEYPIPNKGQKIIEVNKGEHLIQVYNSIFGKGPIKRINVENEVLELDIKANKEILKTLFIIIAIMWVLILFSIIVPIFLVPIIIVFPIIMYVKANKMGAYILEIKNDKIL